MWSDIGKFIGGALAGALDAFLAPILAWFHDRALVKQGQAQQVASDDAETVKQATEATESGDAIDNMDMDALAARQRLRQSGTTPASPG